MKFWRRFWWALVLIPVLLVGGFVWWARTPLGPLPEALAALQSDPKVQVEAGTWYVFRPVGETPQVGVIFYPGGRVDPRAYAPAAHQIAAQGYLVIITPMPLNLAVFNSDQAREVIAAFPEIRHWAVGGHSLGGAMAAHFAALNAVSSAPAPVDGLFLWAAYPAEADDLSQLPIRVVCVYGALDGLATTDKIDAARPLLPAQTQFTRLEGGNHAQFGWYGPQPGDNPAEIGRGEQTRQAVEATLALLQLLGAGQ